MRTSVTSDLNMVSATSDSNLNVEKENECSQDVLKNSLCIALTNYLTAKNDIEAMWVLSDNGKIYQVTFHVEFGVVSDCILQDLAKLGIGMRNHTKILVLPTTFIFGNKFSSRNESMSPSISIENIINNKISPNDITNKMNNQTSSNMNLPGKIRKRIKVSNFKKSVRARLMVHQVVASIRASTALTFDFVLLICLASILAALGLLENSTVIIVASMLVSPLMNPILGFAFGLSVREHSLWRRALRNELIGLIICLACGFILG